MEWMLVFKVEEELRDEAPWVIQRLKDQGYKIIILSGDQHEKVETLARQLKVDEYYANMTPEGKQAFVKELEKREHCLMVGDGLNDALALSEAHVSVHCQIDRLRPLWKLLTSF